MVTARDVIDMVDDRDVGRKVSKIVTDYFSTLEDCAVKKDLLAAEKARSDGWKDAKDCLDNYVKGKGW